MSDLGLYRRFLACVLLVVLGLGGATPVAVVAEEMERSFQATPVPGDLPDDPDEEDIAVSVGEIVVLEDGGNLSAAATSGGVSVSQSNPLPGETIKVSYTFRQDASDAMYSFFNLQGTYPAGTTFAGNFLFTCSVGCLPSSWTYNTASNPVVVNFSVDFLNNGQSQDLVLSFDVTVSASAEPGTSLTFTPGIDNVAGPGLTIIVAEELVAEDASLLVAYEHLAPGAVSSTGGVQPVTYSIQTDPLKGTAVMNADGTFTYTAGAGQTGNDSFAFSATDSRTMNPQVKTGTVTITISDPVTAPDIDLAVDFEGSGSGTVIGAGGIGSLTYAVGTFPGKGTVNLQPDGAFTYAANDNVTGADQFIIHVSDTSVPPLTATATVFVMIGPPPALTADPLTVTVDAGETISGNLAEKVTGGITPYHFALDTPPAQGTATVNPDGSFTFTANPDAGGSDSFTYLVEDGDQELPLTAADSVTGLVTIMIVAAPDPTATNTPVASPTATVTETSTPEVTVTATSTPEVTATATSTPRPILPGRGGDDEATSTETATATMTKPDTTDGVHGLPATGQGTGGNGSWMLPGLLGLSFGLLALGWMSRKRTG